MNNMDTVGITVDMSEQRSATLTNIFTEKKGQIRNFIKKRIRNIAQVEDLLQDVFAQMINTYEDIESMDAWLYTVARNKINDYYRKKKTESLDDIYSNEEDSESLSNLLPDLGNSPDQVYLREVIWEEVMDVLEGLPAEQREAYVMHEFDNYSMKEIAEVQQVTLNTVLSRKRYAVNALKERLEHFYNEL